MQLSDDQIAAYRDAGYLFFPGLFSPEEVAPLQAAMPAVMSRPGPEVVREKDKSGAVRLVYGAHAFADAFAAMSRHPRVLLPVRQLLGEEVYIFQSRLNPKLDHSGGAWDWHQDFGTWHRNDAMPAPRVVMTAIFLDDVTAANAPLMLVPGSQKLGIIDRVTDDHSLGYKLHVIDRDLLGELVSDGGVTPLIGPAGSVAFIDCNLVHGSSNNITPFRRALWYINYNAVSNAPLQTERAWHHNNRDHSPLTPLADDVLAPAGAGAAAE